MRCVKIGEIDIYYELTYKNVKNINLRIKRTGKILVSANRSIHPNKIDEFLVSNSKFILSTLEKIKEFNKYLPKPKQYISGESFKLLGRDLKLKVSVGENENVYSDGIYLFLTTKDTENFERKKNTVNKWLNDQCRIVFDEVVAKIFEKFKKYDAPFPTIKIRDMKTCWGTCQTTRGIITLNAKLIELPRYCIDYVVLHEFSHFIHPNHSKAFHAFVTMMMPDWKERKKILEDHKFL